MRPIKRVKHGNDLRIEVKVNDDSISKVIFHYRRANETAYNQILMSRSSNNVYKATIDGKVVKDRFFYYIEGAERSGSVSNAGSRDAPLSLDIPHARSSEGVDVPVSF